LEQATTADVASALTRHELSNRSLQGFWEVLEQRAGGDVVEAVMAEAGLPPEHVRNPRSWSSYAYYDAVNHSVARRLYGLDELPPLGHELWQLWRASPKASLTPQRLGAALALLRAFSSTESLYRGLPALAKMGNSGLEVTCHGLGPGLVRYRAWPLRTPAAVGPATIWKMVGWFESLPTLWGLPQADVRFTVEETPAGLPLIEYQVQYRPSSTAGLGLPGVLGLVGAGLGGALGAAGGLPVALAALAGGASVLAVHGWVRLVRRSRQAEDDGERLRELIYELDDRYATERRARLTSRKLSGYLATDLVEHIVDDPDREVALGGRRTSAAVLFIDIVAFTSRCEVHTPERIVDELNLYFAHVDPVFQRHRGVIDKRIGDGIMGVFVLRPGEEEASMCARAARCGIDLLAAVEATNVLLVERGSEPLEVRVGVAAGLLVQGNMGSEVRLEHTVVGDTVNLAARLESSAQPGQVLLTREVYEAALSVGPLPAARVDERTELVKGRQAPIDVVELRPAG
jgi:class 3 adenylate cyclase